jgi:hypothetical protein
MVVVFPADLGAVGRPSGDPFPAEAPAAFQAFATPEVPVCAVVAVAPNGAAVLAFVNPLAVGAALAFAGLSLTTHGLFLSLLVIGGPWLPSSHPTAVLILL